MGKHLEKWRFQSKIEQSGHHIPQTPPLHAAVKICHMPPCAMERGKAV